MNANLDNQEYLNEDIILTIKDGNFFCGFRILNY